MRFSELPFVVGLSLFCDKVNYELLDLYRNLGKEIVSKQERYAWGDAITNFTKRLPDSRSDLAQETLKDPYNFDFLTLTQGYKEKELEEALTTNITRFLLELGQVFAFVGRQVPIMVGSMESTGNFHRQAQSLVGFVTSPPCCSIGTGKG